MMAPHEGPGRFLAGYRTRVTASATLSHVAYSYRL